MSKPRISVIVCSRTPGSWTLHERNVARTVGADHEYVRIDNQDGRYGLCAAYNRGVSRSQGDVLAFVHEDVFFMECGWGTVLISKFSADPGLGLIGVAGARYLCADRMAWTAAGRPFLRGRVVHELDKDESFAMTAFSLDRADAEVVAVDGLFFAVRRELFDRVRFDETTFDRFHFYDLDISMQVAKTHRLMVTWDILVKHLSAGNPDDEWRAAGRKFLEKYRDQLPASCDLKTPDMNKQPQLGISIDLRGKVSQETLF